ncbi:MAG: hypothetical protein H0T85_08450 [Geodermatophilaceae bacterium]|nr:hypothetical protein [Geodermatophilaceae bacterium]
MTYESVITCPGCGVRATEAMPEDACRYFYRCNGCTQLLKPREGDCCVFCSYGDTRCPPMQVAHLRGQAAAP